MGTVAALSLLLCSGRAAGVLSWLKAGRLRSVSPWGMALALGVGG